MKASILHRAIDIYTPHLSLKSRKELASICEEQNFKSGTLLFKPNQPEQSEYILLQGIAHTFLLNFEGEEITLSFFEDNTVLPPFVTRTQKGKSILHCKAITDCTFVQIDAKAFESLMIDNLEIREFGNTVLRQELLNKVNKEIRMASWSAKERLEQFRRDFSMLENKIPHPMIASYLGITNVSLSRLRKQT
ncbi:Crp/Fnr family transcriptional regulator [Pricia sp. S334]|uniref:Crp/Fnr family transcriptional regulator n=1 Tax=Pricia mediterranea TaxID=3076079 RepID=A0ABU3L875_9FLAO|nr:Crp/Fnr family transcriptional regulator [Pricia sp. S334]MDT7829573.1 Crp/Fnr family transcriptional regulator [Pricia sp. S334]